MALRQAQIASAFALLTSLTACSLAPISHAANAYCPPSPNRTLNAREMLRYNRCIYSLSPTALAKEYELVDQRFTSAGNGADRIKLALLLSVPNTVFRSISQAQQLLNASEPNGVPDNLRDLAQLLSASLAQQMRLDDQVTSLEKDLAAEKAHSGALQDKIDSVKDLERNALQKDVP